MTHQQPVYDRLKALHRDGRYFRMYGNHDSFLKPIVDRNGVVVDDSVAQTLRDVMEAGEGAPPFTIYDGFVIGGVKTMTEQSGLDLAGTLAAYATSGFTQAAAETMLRDLVRGRLGLDANDYTEKTQMLVTHGHQFDFWNKPENEILGLLIANTVGLFVDRNMDPFLDLRGIAVQGNTWIDFEDLLAGLPVFNSWVSRGPSLRFAHQVQHASNSERVLSDGIMFSESYATLAGTFGYALSWRDPATGQEVTPAQGRASIRSPADIPTYLWHHHFHHLCIGHTHNPHSQPRFRLDDLGDIALPLRPLAAAIRAVLPDFVTPQFKSGYFNSGTGGWLEGVIWGIEIDETGQARLVYWTENSIGPEPMDWELTALPQTVKDGLEAGLEAALDGPVDSIYQGARDLYERIKARLEALRVSPADIQAMVGEVALLPMQLLALGMLAAPVDAEGVPRSERFRALAEVPGALRGKLDTLRGELDRLRAFDVDVFLTAKRHALLAPIGQAIEAETLTIEAPIAKAAGDRLRLFQRAIQGMDEGVLEEQALHFAGMAMAAFQAFPGSLPFFSTMAETLDPAGFLEATDTPVLQSLLSRLWMYPPEGQVVALPEVRITSRFSLQEDSVRLEVTVTAGTATDPGE